MSSDHSQIDHKLSEEYPRMWDSADLADFVRLLAAANDAWPQRTKWEGHTDPQAMARLVKTGLVIPDGKRYTIRGLDKRRRERSDAGRYAARKRWSDADSNADSNADSIADSNADPLRTPDAGAMPDRDIGIDRGRASPARGAVGAYYDLKGGQVSDGAISMIDEMVADHGDDAVSRMLGAEAKRSAIDQTFLSRVKGALTVQAHAASKDAEAARKKADAQYQRNLKDGLEAMTPEQQARAAEAKAEVDRFIKGLPS